MGKRRKINPRRVPVSMAALEQAKLQAAASAVDAVFAVFLTACWDYMGYSEQQLRELWSAVQRVAESVQEGRATIPELLWTLRHEAGIELDGKRYF